mmetsp:Transcript_103572/g.198812  ORF Transcript_103572/g.198812 Transcript_103572/m.198812 type:complete len:190 (+) Transcript_103572:21-590(+)
MGIDIDSGGRYVGHKNRKTPVSENVYLRLLVKLYSFLARRTGASFNKVVLKRLVMSKTNKPPIGVNRVARYAKGHEDKVIVAVTTITDDVRLEGKKFPKLRIAALRFTEAARARIVGAGGECLTLDQLALEQPKGRNTLLIRGRTTARTANKYFGTPGSSGSTSRPRVRSKGNNFEQARGRRKSRGFKV